MILVRGLACKSEAVILYHKDTIQSHSIPSLSACFHITECLLTRLVGIVDPTCKLIESIGIDVAGITEESQFSPPLL